MFFLMKFFCLLISSDKIVGVVNSSYMENLRKKAIKISSENDKVLSYFYKDHLKFIHKPLKILH